MKILKERIHDLKKLFPCGSASKESACNAGDLGSIPGLGRSPEKEKATQSNILAWRIPMDRGAWWATVHGVAKSRTGLSNFTFTLRQHIKEQRHYFAKKGPSSQDYCFSSSHVWM